MAYGIHISITFVAFCILGSQALNCQLEKDVGIECEEGHKTIRFYYDMKRGVCQPMAYKGCGGNENRFDSASACREECQMKPREKAENASQDMTLLINACHISTDALISEKVKSCDAGCPSGYECKDDKYCCPTRSHRCQLPVSSGHEAVSLKHYGRFAYIAGLENCLRFSYFGAEGNINNFKTYQDCKQYCMDGM